MPLIELILPVPVILLLAAVGPVIPRDTAATTGVVDLACAPDQALDREGSRRRTSRVPRLRHRRLQLVARRADVQLGLLHARVHDPGLRTRLADVESRAGPIRCYYVRGIICFLLGAKAIVSRAARGVADEEIMSCSLSLWIPFLRSPRDAVSSILDRL